MTDFRGAEMTYQEYEARLEEAYAEIKRLKQSTSEGGSDYGNFKDHPESVNEIKANKSELASLWSVRDALISALRAIDSGELENPAVAMIAIGCTGDDNSNYTRFFASGNSNWEIVGVAMRAIYMFEQN